MARFWDYVWAWILVFVGLFLIIIFFDHSAFRWLGLVDPLPSDLMPHLIALAVGVVLVWWGGLRLVE